MCKLKLAPCALLFVPIVAVADERNDMRARLRKCAKWLILAGTGISSLSAAPVINAVANAASNIPFGFALAPGSIIVIYGTGLGPDTIAFAPSAFKTTNLSGTTVTITSGTTTANAPLYYTSATQVAALLPSSTPAGTPAKFTVTYNGQTSNSLGHGVATNAVGIFTINSRGDGPAVAMYPDYSLVSPAKFASCGGVNTFCGAANSGDTLILWTTGLGPIQIGDELAGAGLGQDMNLPVTVWLGGVQAPVTYRGRSGCCIGEDQIVFTVPANAPTGCAVPLMVQVNGVIGSTTVIPIGANGSRNCTPANSALSAIDVDQAAVNGPIKFAQLILEKDGKNGGGFQDNSQFAFEKITGYQPGTQPFFLSFIDQQPLGTCMVFPKLGADPDVPITNIADLDAGSNFTLKGPKGTMNVPPNSLSSSGIALNADGTFLVPGGYTITGTGGADVGPFTATFNVAALPTLTPPPATVTRANGMTLAWIGGAGNVQFVISSAFSGSNNTVGDTAQCTAPASAGTFTIPPYIMQNLPSNNAATLLFGSRVAYSPFTASGLDVGSVQVVISGPSFSVNLK